MVLMFNATPKHPEESLEWCNAASFITKKVPVAKTKCVWDLCASKYPSLAAIIGCQKTALKIAKQVSPSNG